MALNSGKVCTGVSSHSRYCPRNPSGTSPPGSRKSSPVSRSARTHGTSTRRRNGSTSPWPTGSPRKKPRKFLPLSCHAPPARGPGPSLPGRSARRSCLFSVASSLSGKNRCVSFPRSSTMPASGSPSCGASGSSPSMTLSGDAGSGTRSQRDIVLAGDGIRVPASGRF